MEGLMLIICVFLVISVFLSYMAYYTARPKVRTVEYELELLKTIDYMQGESLEIIHQHTITTFDGHKVWVGFIPGNPDNKHYVILSHGYTSTRYGVYKYAVLWRKMGFHCVIHENRGHGANASATCTFGIKESKDLMAVIEDTYERYGRDIQIGLHGESMGAGLQLMALSYGPKVDFIVNDCGYSEILPVLRWKVQDNFHLPRKMADFASPYARILFGYWFQDVRPIDRLADNEIPICFVHGKADTFTHCWHSEKMFEMNKGYKELHLFEGADHAECVIVDVDRYMQMLKDFLKQVYAETE